MFTKSRKGYYFWEEFAEVDGIVHGFSTRKFGDMNIKRANSDVHLRMFLKTLGINNKNVIRMNQIHGDNVEVISHKNLTSKSLETIIDNADGLISSLKGIYLVGTFADCVPILFLDKDKKLFGIAHAGWKGAYKEIVKILISKMINKGSSPSNLEIGIGPSIRECCYDIDEEREALFNKKFSRAKEIITKKNGKKFLSLQKLIKLQLKQLGVPQRNILDCKLCTKDNMSHFYSYRGEHGKSSFGLSATVIGKV